MLDSIEAHSAQVSASVSWNLFRKRSPQDRCGVGPKWRNETGCVRSPPRHLVQNQHVAGRSAISRNAQSCHLPSTRTRRQFSCWTDQRRPANSFVGGGAASLHGTPINASAKRVAQVAQVAQAKWPSVTVQEISFSDLLCFPDKRGIYLCHLCHLAFTPIFIG